MLNSWRGRIVFIAALVLVLAGAALFYVWMERAALAERVIGRALAQRGVQPVSFSVGFIGLRSISLRDIEFGSTDNPDATVDSVTVAYAPGELLSGQVRSIDIGEARLRVRLAEGGVSLGVLDPLLAGGGEGGPLSLPPIHVDSAQIRVETAKGNFLLSGPLDVTTDGTATVVTTDAMEISETVAPARFAPVVASGNVRLDGEAISFEGDLSVEGGDAGSVPLLQAEGNYDSAAKTGAATAQGSLLLTRDGVTPATLSPLLQPFYLDIEGGIAYRAEAKIEDGAAEVVVDATLDKLALNQTVAGSASFSGPLRLSKTFGNDDEVSPFRLDLDTLRVDDLSKPERIEPVTIEGHVEFLQPAISAELVARSALPPIRGARLGNLTAAYDMTTGQGKVRASGDLNFSPGKLELQAVVPMLKGTVTRMSGKASYVAEAVLSERGLTSSGHAMLANIGFVASAATVEGLDGTVRLASLLPLRTRGEQTLKVKMLQAGVPLADGTIAFDLDEKGLRIVNATWPFAEGKLVLVSSGASVTASDAQFTLTVQDVDLAALLKMVEVPGLTATGRISGRIPVAIRNGDPILLDGSLAAEDDGVIVYTSGAADAVSGEQTKLLTDALRNFHYTELSGGLSGNANGNLVLGLALRGSNPDLYDGYPFAIDVKLEGSLAEALRRGTVGFRPLELIKQQSNPAVTPPAKKTEP